MKPERVPDVPVSSPYNDKEGAARRSGGHPL